MTNAIKYFFSFRLVTLLTTVLVMNTETARTQVFPITSVVQVTEFSPFIETYDDPGKVVLTILSTDERPEYEVLIRVNLSGPGFNIRTREDYLPFPITLRRNIPLVLTGAQLRDYFDPAHLLFSGQSLSVFQQNGGLLPEGPLSLCVEVFDYNRFFDPPVSNTACANGLMLLHRPPVLLEPTGEIGLTFPQYLQFQWQPQHAGVVVDYTLEIYEHTLPGMADNLIIESTQPLIEINTLVPFYLLTNLDPLLQEDTRYLVRIKAKDRIGNAAFQNNGWSDIYSFNTNQESPPDDPLTCGKPTGVESTVINANTIALQWDEQAGVASWVIYSPVNDSIILNSDVSNYQDEGLIPEFDYTYILCAVCDDDSQYCVKTLVNIPEQEVDTTTCGADLIVENNALSSEMLLVNWNDIPQASAFILTWSEIERAENRNNRTARTDFEQEVVQIPSGNTSTQIEGLETGHIYTFELCKICPLGVQECTNWTTIFEGLQNDCVTNIDFVRVDSTDTSLKLTWTYDEGSIGIDNQFDLIWQISDRSLPADTVHLAYAMLNYTIEDLKPNKAYRLSVCANCVEEQTACLELPPIGGCPAPYTPFLADLSGDNALIVWEPEEDHVLRESQLRFKPVARQAWMSEQAGDIQYFDIEQWGFVPKQATELLGLNEQLTYVAQIQSLCVDSLWSDWSEAVVFCLECSLSDSLRLIDVSDVNANVLGLAQANAIAYRFEYRIQGGNEWISLDNIDQPLLLLSDLLAETTYEVRMRYLCVRGPLSDYSPIFTFTTLPTCHPPALSSVDPILANAAQLNWIPGNHAQQTKLRYRLQLDLMGSLYTPPWQSEVTPDSLVFLENLRGGATYDFQLRSECGVNQSEWTEMDEFVLLCAAPEGVEATDITYESARINLSQCPASAKRYQVDYKLAEETEWLTQITHFPTAILQTLDDLAYYDVRVASICSSGDVSNYSDTVQFQTKVKCLVPGNLLVSELNPLSANIEWDITGTMLEWEILLLDEDPIDDSLTEALNETIPPPRHTRNGEEEIENTSEQSDVNNESSIENRLSTATPFDRNESNTDSSNTPSSTIPESGVNIPIENRAVGDPSSTTPVGVSIPNRNTVVEAPYANWQRFTVTEPNKFFQNLHPDHPYRVVVRARCVEAGWTDFSEELSFRTLDDCKPVNGLFVDQVYQETARTNWRRANSFDDEYMVRLESLEPIWMRPQNRNETEAAEVVVMRSNVNGEINPISTSTQNLVLSTYKDSIQTLERLATFTGLQPNTDYRFQVKTHCDNYGWTDYSDWHIFHTDECAEVTEIIEESIDRSTMRISWTPDYGHNDYEFKYRLANDVGAQWVFIPTNDPMVEISDLLSNQMYDYEIAEVCKGGTGTTRMPQDSFYMQRPSINNGFYVCGMEMNVDLSNQTPLSSLMPEDTIVAFDFKIAITEASGSGGHFSGTGEINIPYFNKAKFAFIFDDIFVNDEYRVVGGYLSATGFGIEVLPPWADSLLADIIEVLEVVDELLEEEQVATLEEIIALGETAGIPDSLQQEIQEVIDCFTQATNSEETAACTEQLEELIAEIDEFLLELNNGDFQVLFTANEEEKYGFDAKGTQELQEWYEDRILAGEHYDIAYKSVRKYSSERVNATISEPGSIDAVKFTQLTSTPLSYTSEGGQVDITFTGQDRDNYLLSAEQITADSVPNHIAGLLNVVTYDELPLNIVLVPLSESADADIDLAAMQQDLEDIFKQAVVMPNVTLAEVFNPTDFVPPLEATTSGLLANYTQQMRQIQSEYEELGRVEENTYYLFLTDNYEQTDRAGFMPRGRQFGYIYRNNAGSDSALSRVIAHELCHGAFVLEHTYEAHSDELPEHETDNLMDKGSGTRLYKWQWDLMHNPVNPPLLEGDESGESVDFDVILDDPSYFGFTVPEENERCFYMPSRAIIKFSASAQLSELTFGEEGKAYPVGSLVSFVLNGIKYIGLHSANAKTFTCYYQEFIFNNFTSPVSKTMLENGGGTLDPQQYKVIQNASEACRITSYFTDPSSCIKVKKTFDPIFYTNDSTEVITNEILIPTIAEVIELGFGCGPGTDIVRAIRANPNIELQPGDEELLEQIEQLANKLGDNLLGSYSADGWQYQTDAYKHLYLNYGQWDQDLDHFYDRLLHYKNKIDADLALIEQEVLRSIPDADRIVLLFNTWDEGELRNLTLEQRIKALKIVGTGSMSSLQLATILVQNGETIALRLIRSLPEEQSCDFLEEFRTQGVWALIDNGVEDVDWLINDDQFKAFGDLMISIVNNCTEIEPLSSTEKENLEAINIGRIRFQPFPTEPDFYNDCSIGLDSEWNATSKQLVFSVEYPEDFVCTNVLRTYSVNPDQYVIITSTSDILLDNTVVFQKGQQLELPAYYLHYYIQENENEVIRTSINVLIEAGLLATGVSQLAVGSKLVRGLAFVDVFVGTGGLVIKFNETKIIQRYGQNGRDFISAYNKIALLTAFGNIGAGIRQAFASPATEEMKATADFVAFIRQYGDEIATDPNLGAATLEDLTRKANALEALIDAGTLFKSHLKMRLVKNGAASDLAESLSGELQAIFASKGWNYDELSDGMASVLAAQGHGGSLLGRLPDWDNNILTNFEQFLDEVPGAVNFCRENLNGVRAWEVLKNAPEVIRNNISVLESMAKLVQHNLLVNIGNATSNQLANIQKYTTLGDYLNNPMRVPITNALDIPNVNLPEFEYQSYLAIIDGLHHLRQTSRLETGIVLRGRPLSEADYIRLFGSTSPQDIPIKGFVSTTRDRGVAEAFANMGDFTGLRYRMIWKIKSKNGVDINDISDWGENLGSIYHPNAQPPIIRNQQEVLLEEGYYRKTSNPQPVIENGSPKIDFDADDNPIYWMEVELEELGTPIRQISN